MTRHFIFTLCLLFITPILSVAEPIEIGDELKETGTRLNITDDLKIQFSIEEKRIIAQFVDAESLLVEIPAESIVFVVDESGHKHDEWRTLLNPDGNSRLISTKVLTPPYNFRARIIIRFTDNEPKTFTRIAIDLDRNVDES